MSAARRKKHLANGKLRPAALRHRRKKNARRREAWLANFAPGARDKFLKMADIEHAVWLAAFQKETGLERAEAAVLLERTGEERRWMKLRTLDRTVVGIAPPKVGATITTEDPGPPSLALMGEPLVQCASCASIEMNGGKAPDFCEACDALGVPDHA